MKKKYANPTVDMVEYTVGDIVTVSGVSVDGAVDQKFSAGLTSEGIGTDNVVAFDFGEL
ncbi:MAG: hypothetical protein ACI4CT_06110 [Lachnospiraceae bacterium]